MKYFLKYRLNGSVIKKGFTSVAERDYQALILLTNTDKRVVAVVLSAQRE
jgi:hypothetical protein